MYTFRFYPRFTDSNPEAGLGNLCFNKLSRGLWCVCIRTLENYWFKLFLESFPKLLHGSVCVDRLSVFLTQGWQTIALRPNPDWSVFSVIKNHWNAITSLYLCAISEMQWQYMTKTVWLPNPTIFTICPFTEKKKRPIPVLELQHST